MVKEKAAMDERIIFLIARSLFIAYVNYCWGVFSAKDKNSISPVLNSSVLIATR